MERVDRAPDGYRLAQWPPAVADYLALRERSGLSPCREDQAREGLRGGWYSVHVVHEPTAATVGMGRVLGDGGWYFHVIDVAVVPEHQHRGIGRTILIALLDEIRQNAPHGAFVNLLADPPGRSLYERFGFVCTAPDSVGMSRRLE